MTDVVITALPPAPLHVLEVWSHPIDLSKRIEAALDIRLPALGCSNSTPSVSLIRVEPTVWLIEGDVGPFVPLLGEDGAITAIGGGIVRVRIAGPDWRVLLMAGGVFDAESPTFATGCSAATIIDHVGVRLWVESADSCIAYVPASFAAGLIEFWDTARRLPLI